MGVFKPHLVLLTYLGGCLQRDPSDAMSTFPKKDKRFLALWLYLSQKMRCPFSDISLGTLWLYIKFFACVHVCVCICVYHYLYVTLCLYICVYNSNLLTLHYMLNSLRRIILKGLNVIISEKVSIIQNYL